MNTVKIRSKRVLDIHNVSSDRFFFLFCPMIYEPVSILSTQEEEEKEDKRKRRRLDLVRPQLKLEKIDCRASDNTLYPLLHIDCPQGSLLKVSICELSKPLPLWNLWPWKGRARKWGSLILDKNWWKVVLVARADPGEVYKFRGNNFRSVFDFYHSQKHSS